MTFKQIRSLGRKLVAFLSLFDDCFGRVDARALLSVYVKGQLSSIHGKTAEAIALAAGRAPRTLQRFLESIKWDEQRLRDHCQQLVALQAGPTVLRRRRIESVVPEPRRRTLDRPTAPRRPHQSAVPSCCTAAMQPATEVAVDIDGTPRPPHSRRPPGAPAGGCQRSGPLAISPKITRCPAGSIDGTPYGTTDLVG